MNQDIDGVDEVRLSGKGLEPLSSKGDADTSSRRGLRDTKKVVILIVLLVVGGGVIAYQFVGSGGPQEASAMPAGMPDAAASQPGAADVESVLQRLETTPQSQDGLSVRRVEELVKEFDTYVQERQVPVAGLRVNPFAATQAAQEEPKQTVEDAAAAAEAQARAQQQRIESAADKLKVGSVIIAGQRSMVIISGKLCRVGDTIEGFRVENIERERVTVSCEGKTLSLSLQPEGRGS